LARLRKRGYESMSDYFEKVNGNQTPLFD
jgi:hypothetical protein